MNNQPQVPMNLDPVIHALTGANIGFDEEQFMFTLIAGNQLRRYMLSPKHAKRFLLLLQKQVAEYETKFGALNTVLTDQAPQQTASGEGIGFHVDNQENKDGQEGRI